MRTYKELKKIVDSAVEDLNWETNNVDQACKYALDGGKRLRPVLLLAFCEYYNYALEAAMPYALAIEFIHNYSLIHDDLPAMDNDSLRRGLPTVHAKYGEDIAILAGDNLLNKAYEIMFKDLYENKELKNLYAAKSISEYSGMDGMIGGQVIDVENSARSLKDIKDMYHKKTSALIQASCIAGASVSGGDCDFAKSYGEQLGLLFQLTDDLLDIEQDEKSKKKTYLSFASKKELERELSELNKSLTDLLKKERRDTFILEEIYKLMLNRTI